MHITVAHQLWGVCRFQRAEVPYSYYLISNRCWYLTKATSPSSVPWFMFSCITHVKWAGFVGCRTLGNSRNLGHTSGEVSIRWLVLNGISTWGKSDSIFLDLFDFLCDWVWNIFLAVAADIFVAFPLADETKPRYSPSANQRPKACSGPHLLPGFSVI